ncbi:MAG: CBS domain-containing protein [Actinomycetota bacterium]|nr:CBS domain-containing protein [Actinomycetota bacterium]
MVELGRLGDVESDTWPAVPASALMDDRPALHRSQRLGSALETMRAAGVERAAVVQDGRIVGVLNSSDVIRVEQILEQLGDGRAR